MRFSRLSKASSFSLPIFYAPVLFVVFVMATAEGFAASQHQAVLVTAERPAADSISTELQTSRVTVVSHESFSTSDNSVADVIARQSGVQVREIGGVGSFSAINIRGASSTQVNVFLDGVLVNSAQGGIVDLSQFLLNSVEKVEIYRGAVPVQLGESGIGGAINIVTKKAGADGNNIGESKLSVTRGSYETDKASFLINDRVGAVDLLGSLEYLKSENDFRFYDDGQTEHFAGDDSVERRNNAGVEHYTGYLSGSSNLNNKVNVGFSSHFYRKHLEIPTVGNLDDDSAVLDSNYFLGKASLDYIQSSSASYSFDLSFSQDIQRYDDLLSQVDVGIDLFETRQDSIDLSGLGLYTFGNHQVALRLDANTERYEISDLIGLESGLHKRVQYALSAQDEVVNAKGNLIYTFDARLFYTDDSYQYVDDLDESHNLTNSDFFSSFHAGVLCFPSSDTEVRSNLSRDIRIPKLNEMFGDRGYSVGNEDLEHEEAINFDLSLSTNKDYGSSSINYFYRYLDDAIVKVFNSRGTGQAQNIGRASVHGIEFDATVPVHDQWDIEVKSTFQLSENRSKLSSENGNSLPGLYDFASTITNRFRVNDLTYSLDYIYQTGGIYDPQANVLMPDISQLNFYIRWKKEDQQLDLSFENLSNQQIEHFNRFPGPGRRFYLTFSQTL